MSSYVLVQGQVGLVDAGLVRWLRDQKSTMVHTTFSVLGSFFEPFIPTKHIEEFLAATELVDSVIPVMNTQENIDRFPRVVHLPETELLEFSLMRICKGQGILPEAASSPKLTTIASLQEQYGVTPGKRHSRVVIASGCFDPLHLGHVRLLEAAWQKGDILVVLVMDMDAIRQHSDKNGFTKRPVYNDAERVEALASLRAVNHIVLLEDRDCLASLRSFCPDTFVKNIKDQSRLVVRAEAGLVESLGGQTIYLHDLKTQYSSSAIIQEIRKRYG